MPVKAENFVSGVGGVHAEVCYDVFMNKCSWGNLNKPGVYVDRESARNSIIPKQNFMRAAEALVEKGEKEKAIALLDRGLEEFPDEKITFDMYMIPFADAYYAAGAYEKGNAITERIFEIYNQNIEYYNRLDDRLVKYYESDYNQALGVIQRLSMMARNNNQSDLHNRIDSVFKEQLQFMQ